MPKSKPKDKLLNRVFAIAFVILSLVFMYYTGYHPFSPVALPLKPLADISPLLVILFVFLTPISIGFTIILYGLFREIWKPSLDFTLNRKRIWIFVSAILFAVVILSNAWWWLTSGFPHWLPEWGLQATLIEYFTGNFAMDTTILSLMFGILFLTNSNPKKSQSYKTMLIGVIFYQIVFFIIYPLMAYNSIAGIQAPLNKNYINFLGYTIFQPWFWCDLTYAIVTFIGAVWLLRKNTNIKKLILIAIVSFVVFFLLVTPFLPKPQFS